MAYRRTLLSLSHWKTRLVLWTGAVLVGAVAAAFSLAGDYVAEWQILLRDHSRYLPLLLTPAGLMLAAWLTRRFFPGAEGSGIPQTIASLESSDRDVRSRVLSLRTTLGKMGLTLLGLFSGASIGREGPTVHLGASIMYGLGRFARFPHHLMERGLIMAGGAAGVGAAFNTPVAGVLFAIEELARSFEERSSGVLLTAVIVAGVVAVALLGNYSYFGSTDASLHSASDWLAVPICGIVGGLLGGIFSRGLIAGRRLLVPVTRSRPVLFAGLCGLVLVGLALLGNDATYGTGYFEARAIVTGQEASPWFGLSKILATVVSYLSGIPGGLFSPSLSAGAGIGAMLAQWIPGTPVTAVVLLGMVAYFSGVVQTPITASVIVMEMTANHAMILPIMSTAFLAMATSRLICRHPIYQALAQDFLRGIRTPSWRDARADSPAEKN